jgi:hypothetical protein
LSSQRWSEKVEKLKILFANVKIFVAKKTLLPLSIHFVTASGWCDESLECAHFRRRRISGLTFLAQKFSMDEVASTYLCA